MPQANEGPQEEAGIEVEKVTADAEQSGDSTTIVNFLAQFGDRPDLLIETLEKNDPGFIKRVNEMGLVIASSQQTKQDAFARLNAYATMVVSLSSCLMLIGAVYYALWLKAGFMSLIAIGFMLVALLGGPRGWGRISESIAKRVFSRGDD